MWFQEGLENTTFKKSNYRGSLPNETFGSGKKSHWPNFALAKYLPNSIFG